jgi:hypothetical protein
VQECSRLCHGSRRARVLSQMREPERETAPIDRSGEWVHPAGRADPAIGLPKPQSVVAASRGLELDELRPRRGHRAGRVGGLRHQVPDVHNTLVVGSAARTPPAIMRGVRLCCWRRRRSPRYAQRPGIGPSSCRPERERNAIRFRAERRQISHGSARTTPSSPVSQRRNTPVDSGCRLLG